MDWDSSTAAMIVPEARLLPIECDVDNMAEDSARREHFKSELILCFCSSTFESSILRPKRNLEAYLYIVLVESVPVELQLVCDLDTSGPPFRQLP